MILQNCCCRPVMFIHLLDLSMHLVTCKKTPTSLCTSRENYEVTRIVICSV
ncbi:hypothetical protein SEVIR_5G363950v4 [Setaria viridis]